MQKPQKLGFSDPASDLGKTPKRQPKNPNLQVPKTPNFGDELTYRTNLITNSASLRSAGELALAMPAKIDDEMDEMSIAAGLPDRWWLTGVTMQSSQ
jgi:hypothetical protein